MLNIMQKIIFVLLIIVVAVLIVMSIPRGKLKSSYVWKSDNPAVSVTEIDQCVLSAETVRSLLGRVMDPELHVSITDLGLIRDISIKDNSAHIVMTLTVPTCPFAKDIIESVRGALFSHPGMREARLDLTFEPPWSWEDTRPGLREELIMRMHGQKDEHVGSR